MSSNAGRPEGTSRGANRSPVADGRDESGARMRGAEPNPPIPDAPAPTRHPAGVQDHEPAHPLARETSVRLARRAEVALLALVAVDLLLLATGTDSVALAAAGLVLAALLGATLSVERRMVDRTVARSAANEASMTRMLRGLSRSTSVDATIDAIVDDLREASGADHVVVARLRPAERIVEATLVSSSAGVPLSTVRFPASDLEPADALSVRATDHDRRTVGLFARIEREAHAGEREPQPAAQDQPAAPAESESAESESAARPGSTLYAVERIADRVSRSYGLRHVLAEPLVAGGQVIGALVLSRRTDSAWPEETRILLRSAAQDLSAALERAYAHEEARIRAATDALTGIPNRAYFEDLADMLGRGRRANDSLGVLMLDIDHFKAVNDRYGHEAGDDVLRALGRVLRMTVRADDVPARYGGEEFVVVLRRATPETALEIAERLRRAVRRIDTGPLGIGGPVTVSIGVSVGTGSARSLLSRADAALYEAKRRGRDRVEVG